MDISMEQYKSAQEVLGRPTKELQLGAHRRFGSVPSTFGGCLSQLLAEFVQFTGGMGTVGIVITGQEDLFSLVEDVICNIHCGSN